MTFCPRRCDFCVPLINPARIWRDKRMSCMLLVTLQSYARYFEEIMIPFGASCFGAGQCSMHNLGHPLELRAPGCPKACSPACRMTRHGARRLDCKEYIGRRSQPSVRDCLAARCKPLPAPSAAIANRFHLNLDPGPPTSMASPLKRACVRSGRLSQCTQAKFVQCCACCWHTGPSSLMHNAFVGT